MKYFIRLCVILMLIGCANSTQPESVSFVPFAQLTTAPELYSGKMVETECLITTDGFETQWLLQTLYLRVSRPVDYTISRQVLGADTLYSAMRDTRIASVRIRGKFAIVEKALPPGNLHFEITHVLSASPAKKPNQLLRATGQDKRE